MTEKIYNMDEWWDTNTYNQKLSEENKLTEEYYQKIDNLEKELKEKIRDIWKKRNN